MKTAVEWFNEEINKLNVGIDARMFIAKLFEKAKEMEKQQILDAYTLKCKYESCNDNRKNCSCGINYYNEIFKNTENDNG